MSRCHVFLEKLMVRVCTINRKGFQRMLIIFAALYGVFIFHGAIVSILTNEIFIGTLLLIILYLVANPARTTVIVGLIFVSAIITPSPIIPAVTAVTGNIFYLGFVAISFVLLINRFKYSAIAWIFVIIILCLQAVATIYWSEPKLFVLPVYFLSALLVATSLKNIELFIFIDWATNFLIVLLIGAFIGLFYTVILGGEALWIFNNEDTRSNGLYLTTLSNWYVRGVIRPSGIYDEPGALSLVICLIAAIRDKVGAPRKTTLLILVMGLITLSVAHIIFLILYLINDSRKAFMRTGFKYVMILALIYIPISNSPFGCVFDEFLFGRFEIVDGRLVGDNRSALIENSIRYLQDFKVVLFGLDSDCIAKPAACQQKGYDQFGDNPLGPLVLGGITQFFPFYAVIGSLLIASVMKMSPIVFGTALILLLRNEVMSYGYALLILIYIVLVFDLRFERHRRNLQSLRTEYYP